MNKLYTLSLFIFRRDLRCNDNSALLHACKNSEYVLPCFIFDPRQVSDDNSYKSSHCIEFMIESLQDLTQSLEKKGGRLFVFKGIAHEVIEKLLQELPIGAVYCNKDYTPFSIERDDHIAAMCTKYKRGFHTYHDALLTNPDMLLTQQNKPYTVFTPFFKSAQKHDVERPHTFHCNNFYKGRCPIPLLNLVHEVTAQGIIGISSNAQRVIRGGRAHSARILQHLSEYKDYIKNHDIPAHATTHLSAYLKFGTHSVREVYHAIIDILGTHHPLIRQLYWRDFFTYIAYYFPFVFGNAFHANYNNLSWNASRTDFKKWCNGQTGFPLVDAGMRQLNTTGFMHNRVRMVVASFLVKDLHIDWRWGERYFATQLVDYDPAVNNGNWQWCASTGCDAQPYFRIFNPWLQQKKFDPACEYIKTWVPELRAYDARTIHAHEKKNVLGYEKPMLDHAKERLIALKLFKQVNQK